MTDNIEPCKGLYSGRPLDTLDKSTQIEEGKYTNWRESLSTVDLLVKATCFVKKRKPNAANLNWLVQGGQWYYAFPLSKGSLEAMSSKVPNASKANFAVEDSFKISPLPIWNLSWQLIFSLDDNNLRSNINIHFYAIFSTIF